MDGSSNIGIIPPASDDEAPAEIILLTGAGASCHIGLPTLDGVLNEASGKLAQQDAGELIRELKNQVEAGKGASAVFEELVAALKFYLRTAHLLKDDDIFTSRLGQLPHRASTGEFIRTWQQALTVCYRTLLEIYGPQNVNSEIAGYQTYISLLTELAALNGGHLHVYTTNYDCAYQVMASNTDQINFLTHISNETGYYSEERWFPARKEVQPTRPQVYVHRLHGCVAWYVEDSPYRIEEIFGAGDNLIVDDEHKLHLMCIKLVTSQEIGTNIAFLTAFQEFYEHLRTARALLVWGFSFRDLEVLRAINHAFSLRKDPLPIYYIDPFLTEPRVVQNIRSTLSSVPVKISSEFAPRRIFWYPQHGDRELIQRAVDTLSGGVP